MKKRRIEITAFRRRTIRLSRKESGRLANSLTGSGQGPESVRIDLIEAENLDRNQGCANEAAAASLSSLDLKKMERAE